MGKSKTLRVVSQKVADKEVFYLEVKSYSGWGRFKMLNGSISPSFSSQDEAIDFVKKWEGSDTKKVVSEFTFNS